MKRRPSILSQKQIDYLKRLIEIKFDKPLEKRKHYSALYQFINEKLSEIKLEKDNKGNVLQGGDSIGENTVFRIWGRLNDEHQTDDTTYQKLASILGFKTLRAYINNFNAHQTDKPLFDPQSINVEKLQENEEIRLGWFPFRYLDVKYLGNYEFEVLNVTGESIMKIGDKFKAKKFVLDFYYSINDNSMGFPPFPKICASMNKSNVDI